MPDGLSSHNNSRFPDSAMALTFDDVLIRPGPSDVLPNEVEVGSRVTRSISVNIPILSSAMCRQRLGWHAGWFSGLVTL